MKSRLPESDTAPNEAPFSFSVELCAQCRRETLPQRKHPGYRSMVLRAASEGMTRKEQAPDPKAAKIRKRRAEKRAAKQVIRAAIRGDVEAVKTYRLDTRFAPQQPAPSENCPRCERRRKVRAA